MCLLVVETEGAPLQSYFLLQRVRWHFVSNTSSIYNHSKLTCKSETCNFDFYNLAQKLALVLLPTF